MPATTIEERALRLLKAFENAGQVVTRVIVEGRKIELVLSKEQAVDEFDGIDMCHDKT